MAAPAFSSHRARTRPGFTLLEVMLAVAILVIITVVVVQFTELTVQSAEISSRDTEQGLACNGLRHLLAAEFAELPVNQDGALVGMNIRSHGIRRDAMQIVCPAGNGLLTPDAKGFYQITLVLREIPRGSGKMVLGLERQPWTDDDDDDDDDDAANATPAGKAAAQRAAAVQKLPSDWVPLLPGVQQLEIAYFDRRLNSWVDRWTDQEMLPDLVRVRLTLAAGQPPYELVEHVPNGGLKRLPPPVVLPNVNGRNNLNGSVGQPPSNGGNTAVRSQPQS